MLNYETPLDRAFQALADPTRRAMVERLAQGPASVSELKRPLDMSLPAVMQHLAVLETSGLVVIGEGGHGCAPAASIRPRSPKPSDGSPSGASKWERRLDRLGEYLKSLNSEGEER